MNKREKIIQVIRAVIAPVLEQWPLWLTIVITFSPQALASIWYHVRIVGDFGFVLLENLFNGMCVSAVMATIIVWLVSLMKHRAWPKCLVYTIVLLLWLVSFFLMKNFSTFYTPQVLQLIMETNHGESVEFLRTWIGMPGTRRALILLALVLVLVLVAERWRKVVLRYLSHAVPMLIVSLLLVAMLGRGLWLGQKFLCSYHSLYDLELAQERFYTDDVISSVHMSLMTLKLQRHETAAAIKLAVHEAQAGTATCDIDSMDLVLVIGESYNKRHSSLYGYPLETSPLMRAERDAGLLVVFSDVISPFNLTSVVLKNLLSVNSVGAGEQWHEYPAWMAVMKHAGWQVDFWDNQRNYMANNVFGLSLNSYLFAQQMQDEVYHAVNERVFTFDEELVDDFFKKVTPAKRNLVIFHLMGQHTSYNSRYPHNPQWAVWTVADVPNKSAFLDDSRRQVILDFDRATRYNDYVLSRIIDRYRDRNAVVVMLSDHGEEVYDYRDFIERDHNPHKTVKMVECENEIPFWIWYSPVYQSRYPQRVAAIKAAADRPFMNDIVGQMMLWLGEVRSQWTDSTRNVLHPAFNPAPRLMYDGIDYDAFMGQ